MIKDDYVFNSDLSDYVRVKTVEEKIIKEEANEEQKNSKKSKKGAKKAAQ